MNIWNNYITSVRTKIQVKQDKKLLTERQWKLKHFVKINDKCGKYLWINAYCPSKELYLWDEEVRPMTEKELTNYRTEEKAEGKVAVRVRGGKDLGAMSVEDFIKLVQEDVATRRNVNEIE